MSNRRMRLRRNGRTRVVNAAPNQSDAFPYLFHGVYVDVDPTGCEYVEEVTDANSFVSTDVTSDGSNTTQQTSYDSGYSQTSQAPVSESPSSYSPPPSGGYTDTSGGSYGGGGGGYDGGGSYTG